MFNVRCFCVREDFTEAFHRYIPTSELDALRTVAENRLSEKDQQ
jgi:hypothetical protein